MTLEDEERTAITLALAEDALTEEEVDAVVRGALARSARPAAGRRWPAVAAALVIVGFGALIALLGDADERAPELLAGPKYEGRWMVSMERPGWQPAVAKGTLILEKKGKSYGGSLTFRILMNGQSLSVTDVEVKRDGISFRLDAEGFDIRMRAHLKDGRLEGRCVWKGAGDWEWTAEPERKDPVERIDKGLSFARFFPKGDAEKLGLDGDALDSLVRTADETGTDALLILKDGHVVCERYSESARAEIHIMSVTKMVTSLLVGLLIEEGRIESLDAPVATWFPEWGRDEKAGVTLRHLLTHTSGIEHRRSAGVLNAETDKVAFVRRAPLTAKPGSEYSYSNEAVALLSGVIAAAAGRPADAYAAEKLFRPLGIRKWQWDRDEAGNTLTYANLALSARDLAWIGQIFAAAGRVGSKRIVAPETLAILCQPATPLAKDQGVLCRLVVQEDGTVVGCYHTGWLGQWLVALPERGIVGVRLRQFRDDEDAARVDKEFGSFLTMLRRL